MKEKTFEKELPVGYEQAFHINAKNVKIGVILNLIAMVVLVIVMVIAAIPVVLSENISFDIEPTALLMTGVVFLISMILYIVLHELVHGAAYKRLTGEKLTFGISWSCAFCGVPNIFTYRRTALIALAAPLVVFTVLLIPVTVALYFVHPVYYFASAFLLGLHLGGCSGDIYMLCLLLTKFKDERLLMKDTGPEQFIYLPKEN